MWCIYHFKCQSLNIDESQQLSHAVFVANLQCMQDLMISICDNLFVRSEDRTED